MLVIVQRVLYFTCFDLKIEKRECGRRTTDITAISLPRTSSVQSDMKSKIERLYQARDCHCTKGGASTCQPPRVESVQLLSLAHFPLR